MEKIDMCAMYLAPCVCIIRIAHAYINKPNNASQLPAIKF